MTYHYGLQWCSIPDCSCGKPGRVCAEWMGYQKVWDGVYQGPYNSKDKESWPLRWCPCCGWEKKDHKPLIHKGGKPRG
ncbi:MAG TPA: hypothetical protein VLJ40_11175 [Arthrobacter sp.]|nr:hypothetical protein [Arthrobacter sp.]